MSASARTQAIELIEAHAVELKLATVKRRYRQLADEAVREQQTPVAYLAALLEAEHQERAERRERRRLIDARFPLIKRLEDFRFTDNPNIPQTTIAALTEGSWIDDRESAILLGESGTGKTHLATALAVCACQQGRRVRVTRSPALSHASEGGAVAESTNGSSDVNAWDEFERHRVAVARARAHAANLEHELEAAKAALAEARERRGNADTADRRLRYPEDVARARRRLEEPWAARLERAERALRHAESDLHRVARDRRTELAAELVDRAYEVERDLRGALKRLWAVIADDQAVRDRWTELATYQNGGLRWTLRPYDNHPIQQAALELARTVEDRYEPPIARDRVRP